MQRKNNPRPKTAIIVGCGISGAAAAEELINLGYEVVILEKNAEVGGKLKSVDGQDLGAMVLAANYKVIDTLVNKNIQVEEVLPGDESVNQILYGTTNPSFYDKLIFAKNLSWQYLHLAMDVSSYKSTIQNLEETTTPDHHLDFETYTKKYNLYELANYMKIWVPGMGYGTLSANYVFRVINYMGYGMMPSLCLGETILGRSLYSVRGGYQTVVKKMTENMDVRTNVKIQEIIRSQDGVTVTYYDKSSSNAKGKPKACVVKGDLIVFTMSPYYWGKLGMELSPLERSCVEQLKYVRYPVAICDIKGYPAKQSFVPEALENDGLGHIGFISTKDMTPGAGCRRVVVYMNLAPDQLDFSLKEGCAGREVLINDLAKLGYAKCDITILHTKNWKDYNPTLPFALGMQLERNQGLNKTIYVGSYGPKSFETVAAAEESTRDTIRSLFDVKQKSEFDVGIERLNRAYNFFYKLNRNEASNNVGANHCERPGLK